MTTTDIHLNTLRELIYALTPAGNDGFEALVASALADVTDLTFRLAKSGSQFGKDASTPLSAFAIAMEAKRYDEKIGLDAVAGKALIAGNALAGKIDLWILASTVEVGDATEGTLREILQKEGISLLTLDWTPRPLQRLAVLLAAAREVTIAWFATHAPSSDKTALGAALAAIAEDPKFDGQVAELRKDLSAAEVGRDSLRKHSFHWLHARLTDRTLSGRSFGQHILVQDPTQPAVPRTALVSTLDSHVAVPLEPTVVAVLGDEGVGKTWLVAQWWATLAHPPIAIMVSGRRATLLDPGHPLDSLARLIADQVGPVSSSKIDAWSKRLLRWKKADPFIGFVVVLDGLNEHPAMPWADIIKGLSSEVRELGGVLIATCRPAYWKREIECRIRNSVATNTIVVTGYSDPELASKLAAARVLPQDLPAAVREFIRTPRICSLALDMLGRLRPDELTVERLLLEYWSSRLIERGDLLSHNASDFHKLIRSHAQAWMWSAQRWFDRDEWQQHSGLARRLGGARPFHDDLTEIEEGRFLSVSQHDPDRYTFRAESLPFAIGLLITSELKQIHEKTAVISDEDVLRIIDPI